MEYENIMAVLDRRIGEMQHIIDYYREHTAKWEKEHEKLTKELEKLTEENMDLKNRIYDLEHPF